MASGTGGFGGQRGKPYRRRKPLPALVLIAVLGVAAVVVWINALSSAEDLAEAISCEPKATPPADTTFTRLAHDALADTTPIPPGRVAVQVLNANGTRGQASITTAALHELGFDKTAEPANDPAYPKGRADCHGQIRFGPNGERAARTVQLIDPCMELVRDSRQDASVDLAIGADFTDVSPSEEAMRILERLSSWADRDGDTGHSEQSAEDGPVIDEDLLAAAVTPTHC